MQYVHDCHPLYALAVNANWCWQGLNLGHNSHDMLRQACTLGNLTPGRYA